MSKSFGLPREEQVPDPATDQIGHVAVVLQAVQHLQGIRVDIAAGDGVLRTSQYAGGMLTSGDEPGPRL